MRLQPAGQDDIWKIEVFSWPDNRSESFIKYVPILAQFTYKSNSIVFKYDSESELFECE